MEILTAAQKIKKLREEKGMSLKELGGDFVTSAQLSYVENDKSSPSMKLLSYLAEKLDVELEYLLETEKTQAENYCNLMLDELEIKIGLNNNEQIDKLYKKILDLAEKYNLNAILGDSKLLISQLYTNKKEYSKALDSLEESLFYFIKVEKYKKVAINYIKQGNVYYKKELYDVALQKYRQAQYFYSKSNVIDLKIESDILFNLSACYKELKNVHLALKYAQEACRIDEKLKDKKRYASSLLKYSATLIRTKDYKNAKTVLSEAKSIIEQEENQGLRASLENNLGIVYLEMGKYEEAYSHLIRSRDLKEKLNSDELPNTLYELYRYYYKTKQTVKALEILSEGIEFSKKRNLKRHQINGINHYIDFLVNNDDFDNAILKIKELIELLNETGYKKDLAKTYLKLVNLLKLSGKDQDALDVFNKAFKLISEL